MKKPLYQVLAGLIQARANCEKSGNTERFNNHEDRAEELIKNHLPSGSGWDSGTQVDWDKSTQEKIVLYGEWHKMDENGFYCGWTPRMNVIVTASLADGMNIKITGRDWNGIKDHLYESFMWALNTPVDPYAKKEEEEN